MFCLSLPFTAQAQTNAPVVTINGTTVEHALTSITFSGDNVILHFSDGTADATADMSTVSIEMATLTSIGQLETFATSELVGNTLTLGGVAVGERIAIYDVTGKKLMQTTATASTTSLSLDALQKGVYIVRAGHNIIKFQKK